MQKKIFHRPKCIVKRTALKVLEDNIEENLRDLGDGDDFLDTISKAQCMKDIIDRVDFIKVF